jgi:hypothetical protein
LLDYVGLINISVSFPPINIKQQLDIVVSPDFVRVGLLGGCIPVWFGRLAMSITYTGG